MRRPPSAAILKHSSGKYGLIIEFDISFPSSRSNRYKNSSTEDRRTPGAGRYLTSQRPRRTLTGCRGNNWVKWRRDERMRTEMGTNREMLLSSIAHWRVAPCHHAGQKYFKYFPGSSLIHTKIEHDNRFLNIIIIIIWVVSPQNDSSWLKKVAI